MKILLIILFSLLLITSKSMQLTYESLVKSTSLFICNCRASFEIDGTGGEIKEYLFFWITR